MAKTKPKSLRRRRSTLGDVAVSRAAQARDALNYAIQVAESVVHSVERGNCGKAVAELANSERTIGAGTAYLLVSSGDPKSRQLDDLMRRADRASYSARTAVLNRCFKN